MDYKDKYLKYKNKYLELKSNNMIGGGKEIKTNDNMKLIPKNSTSKHFIKLEFPNIRVAQCEYSEGPVGLTCITYDSHSNSGSHLTNLYCINNFINLFIN